MHYQVSMSLASPFLRSSRSRNDTLRLALLSAVANIIMAGVLKKVVEAAAGKVVLLSIIGRLRKEAALRTFMFNKIFRCLFLQKNLNLIPLKKDFKK